MVFLIAHGWFIPENIITNFLDDWFTTEREKKGTVAKSAQWNLDPDLKFTSNSTLVVLAMHFLLRDSKCNFMHNFFLPELHTLFFGWKTF